MKHTHGTWDFTQQINELLSGLSNKSMQTACKNGKIMQSSVNSLAKITVCHISACWFSFMDKPKFSACKNFYANCSFQDMQSTKKGIEAYNKINKDKIQQFDKVEDLIKFVNNCI